MTKRDKDILITTYKEFSAEENSEKKKLLRLEIFNILESKNNLNSGDFHIWGLTYYMSEGDKDYDLNLALSSVARLCP